MLGVRVRLQDVFALAVQALERALNRRIQHIGDAQARFVIDLNAPDFLEDVAHGFALHMAVAGQFMRERAHIARALHVVLPAQRVHAHTGAADIARHHRQVGNADDRGRALGMLSHAQPVIDRTVSATRIKAGRCAHFIGLHARQQLHRFGRVLGLADKFGIVLEFIPIAAVADEIFVKEPLSHDHMGQGGDDRHVGARCKCQVVRCLDMRAFHHFGAARINHDQLGPLTQALFQAAGEDRVARDRIGPDHNDHIGLFYRIKVLRSSRGAQRLAQAVTRGRVADACAGVGVVVQEDRTGKFLHEIGFFVGAARRGDHADRMAPMIGNDALHAVRGKLHRLGPRHFFPRIVDAVADHRAKDAVFVAGIAVSKAALHAGMATVGLAVLVGRHAHQFIAAQFGLERTAHAAIRTSRDH